MKNLNKFIEQLSNYERFDWIRFIGVIKDTNKVYVSNTEMYLDKSWKPINRCCQHLIFHIKTNVEMNTSQFEINNED